jgi:release factor glutamine methyltransferase
VSTERGTLLADAISMLATAGIASPRVDAELLLAHALGIERGRLPSIDSVPQSTAEAFRAAVLRRAAREPVQHILGAAPFRYVELAVGPGVFVPRPETELLVDAVLPHLVNRTDPVVVDLCAGSGALALALATEIPRATVYAVELLDPALTWLRRNAAHSGMHVVQGDVTDPGMLGELAGQADAVVSNPPYVPAATAVDPEVRADPPEAVFAGADGLALIPSVLARAAALLRPGGVLALEHDDTHGASVPGLLAASGDWQDIADRVDLSGRPRFAVAVRR